jgi:hypothetical protein
MARRTSLLLVVALLGFLIRVGSAQTKVALPDLGQTTLLTAWVSEQVQIAVPSGIRFRPARTASLAAARPASVSISRIVLPTDGRQLRLSLRATSSRFTVPAGAVAWSAAAVTWNAATWGNGTGSAGALSSTAFTVVATADPDFASMATSGLTFTLLPEPDVRRAGSQTLTVTWKIENIGL